MLRRELRVYGTPAPQGSKRAFNNRIVEVSKRVKPWREAIVKAAEKQPYPMMTKPVVVRIVFFFERPKSHYRTGRNSGLLKDTAPHNHITTPDLDKLVRSTLDGCVQAGMIEDDKLVVTLHATKRYTDETGGASIVLEETE